MSAPAPWPASPPANPEQVLDAIAQLYRERGASHYDEAVTQHAHAVQTAARAEAEGAPDKLVAAALLHDIGHLLVGEHQDTGEFLARDEHHERVGAATLRRWFPTSVTDPIALHVLAKRYLVTVDAQYRSGLSAASERSLALQGGPMSPAEAQRFTGRRHAEEACRLRRWDDASKVAGAQVPDFVHFTPHLLRALRDVDVTDT